VGGTFANHKEYLTNLCNTNVQGKLKHICSLLLFFCRYELPNIKDCENSTVYSVVEKSFKSLENLNRDYLSRNRKVLYEKIGFYHRISRNIICGMGYIYI
jgi:hypothetical protein